MAESSIEVPTSDGTAELATELVGGVHHQGVKVGVFLVDLGVVFVSGLVEATSYDPGDVVGDPAEVEGIPVGVYGVRSIALADAGGEDIPDDLLVTLIPHAAGEVPAYGGDGDAFAPNDALAFHLKMLEPTTNPFFPRLASFAPASPVFLIGRPFEAAGSVAAGATFDLQVGLVAPTGRPASPSDPGVSLEVLLDRVGPVPSPLVP